MNLRELGILYIGGAAGCGRAKSEPCYGER
jgi:hypothetical protein